MTWRPVVLRGSPGEYALENDNGNLYRAVAMFPNEEQASIQAAILKRNGDDAWKPHRDYVHWVLKNSKGEPYMAVVAFPDEEHARHKASELNGV